MQLAYFSSQIKCVSCVFSVSVSILYSRWTQMNDIVARYLRYNTLRWWLVGQRTLDIASNPNWKYLAERQESAQIKRVIPLWNIITIHSHSGPGPNIIIMKDVNSNFNWTSWPYFGVKLSCVCLKLSQPTNFNVSSRRRLKSFTKLGVILYPFILNEVVYIGGNYGNSAHVSVLINLSCSLLVNNTSF